MGNVSTQLVRHGMPGEVGAAARQCLVDAGPRLILSTACDVPADSPPKNVQAIVDTARS
jgi:uroporphyrinogen-III decarboxylase